MVGGRAGALIIRFVGDTRSLDKASQRSMKTLSRASMLAVGGVVALGASVVNLEKQFSQTMNITAAVTKAPASKMRELQALALQLGKDTSFSANEAATAMLELAKGGLTAATIKGGALAGTLQLASAGGTDLATAASIAANALNTFGLKGKDMATVSAALAGGANASTASVESLGMALGQVGPGAHNAGLSLNETVAALAAFDSAGIKGSDAGTSLKTMLTRLVPSTDRARAAMRELGIDFTNSDGSMKSIAQVAEILKNKMGGLSQEQRTLAMNTIFGSDATRAATVLMNEGAKGLGKYIKATKDQGAASRAAEARMKGTSGALERLSGSWETLQLKIGLAVAPAVSMVADRFAGLTNILTDNSRTVLIIIGVIAALAVAVLSVNVAIMAYNAVVRAAGPFTWLWNTAVAAAGKHALGTRIQLAALVTWQKIYTVATKISAVAARGFGLALRFAMGPVGLIITAIGLLVGALVWFFTKTKLGKAIVKNVWSGIKSAIKGVSDWWTKSGWPAIKRGIDILGRVFKFYAMVVKFVWVTVVWGTLKKVWGWIKKNVFDKFVLGLKVWAAIFRFIAGRVAGYFHGLRERLGNTARWIRERVFDRIGNGLKRLRDWFRSAKDAIGRIWDGLKRAAAKPVNFLIKWVWNKGLRNVLNAIPGVNLKEVPEVRFAKGGPVRGGIAGRDSVRAWLKPGEHVWTDKEVAAIGGHRVMKQMRNAALSGNLYGGDPKFAGGGSLSTMDIVKGQRFARSQVGKPYGWGAVGPWAYDCSGFMSAITNVINNAYPHTRRGATSSFPWLGFERGPGQFTIGSTPNYGGSGIGHMAGTLGGMNVESRSGRGVIVGSSALGAAHGGFSQMAHLGRPGLSAMRDSSGGWLETIADVLRAMRKLPGQITELLSSGSWLGPFMRKMAAGLWSNIATFINNKIPDWGPIPNNPIPRKFAKGGLVKARPGGTHIIAGEAGYDEAIVPLGGGRRRVAGGAPIYLTVEIGGKAVGKAIIDPLRREIKNISGGDVQLALGRGRSN
jgi:TP901 family phage tail tape measure protein